MFFLNLRNKIKFRKVFCVYIYFFKEIKEKVDF